MDEILQALSLKQQLDSLRPIEPEKEARIMQKFRLDWNYHSNNLEGNSLTYGETKALLMFGITAQGKPLKDHFEVTGHNEAINWVIDVVKGDYPLTQNFIRELHTLLLKEPYQVDAQTPDGKPTKKWIQVGSYKTLPNHVHTKTGEMFYFATPEETPAKMGDLIAWYNEQIDEAEFNPILLAAEFHYKFIRIHPFDDGNGRTARILMNFILMKFGYPPVIIKTEDKANYFAALQLADAGQLQAFLNYIAQNLVHSLNIMIAGANGESIEEPDDIDKEIALLEKKLTGLGETSKVGKTEDSLTNLLFGLTNFKNKIIGSSLKFQNFYINVSTHYAIIENKIYTDIFGDEIYREEVLLSTDYDQCISLVSKEAIQLTIEISFDKFNRVGFRSFDYKSIFEIKFSNISYSIAVNELIEIERPYGFYLTDLEIDTIINKEAKRHTAFIEQKIAEKETGN